MLKVKNLSLVKSRGNVLQDISLEIPEKRISLLLGKSGSGKTSILRCIAQLENPYIGEIVINEQPVKAMNSRERSQAIGFVPQFFALFPHLRIRDNCLQPLRLTGLSKEAAEKKVDATLESLNIGNLADRKPHELSGGQQQRAVIARALVLDPSFLLFDEPTSALDPENTELFIGILRQLRSKGIIIASQDMAFAAKVLDRAFFMENGELLERYDGGLLPLESKLGQFLGDKDLVNKYLGSTSRELDEPVNSTLVQQDYAITGVHRDHFGDRC
jgi:ABC-type polar amino acid transport system ATPase subunit